MWIKLKCQQGFILITSIILLFVCSGIIMAYYTNIEQEYRRVEINIIKSKAKYNAVSGFAIEAYENMFYQELITDTLENGLPATETKNYNSGIIKNMGGYDSISVSVLKDTINGQLYRYGKSKGYAKYGTFWGDTLIFNATMDISTAQLPTLAHYMYLTGDEKAGGAPQTLYNGERASVKFRNADSFGGGPKGRIQSNGIMEMVSGDCPEFFNTVTVTEESDGTVLSPLTPGCNADDVFQGEPPLDTSGVVCLPPENFDRKKLYADYTFDATEKLFSANGSYPGGFLRDTLIMTEIKFIESGGFRVTRYWYLMPPHLKAGYFGLFPDGNNLDTDGCIGTGCTCSENNLTNCNAYEQFLNRYHARTLTNGVEEYIDEDVRFSHGTHHFDTHNFKFDPNLFAPEFSSSSMNSTMVTDDFYSPTNPVAIYVKGGPVMVHGTYIGKYTIITDEYITYVRHAYPTNSPNPDMTPRDTIMCNIWLVDDLVNADAINGSMALKQPTENCLGGSNNIMGLVSGANVIIANTRANGARSGTVGNLHININAHMIAFNESFTIQFWQNSTSYWNDCNNNNTYGGYPTYLADGNGRRYSNSYPAYLDDDDDRGNIYLWGGFVQMYRGYMFRNLWGPYDIMPGIGMDKHYSWDDNLRCTTPPLYPERLEGNCDDNGSFSGQYDFKIKQFRII